MTGRDDRLARLYPGLTAQERVKLMLRAWKAKQEHDYKIRSTLPDRQVPEYNRLIGLMVAASGDLTHYIFIVVQLVDQLSLRWCWLTSLQMAAVNAADLAETAARAMPTKRERAALQRALRPGMARFAMSLADAPRWRNADEVKQPNSDAIAAGLIAGMRDFWPQRWRELRAAEIVVGEVAQELGGEDPLHPAVRTLLDACRADLLALKARIEPYTGALTQEEPDGALLEEPRAAVRRHAEQ